MKLQTSSAPLEYTVYHGLGIVVLNPGVNEIVLDESDLIMLLSDIQAGDTTLAEQEGL